MAKLKSGTRIYGTATIDTSVVVGSAVTLSSSGIQVTGIVTATSFSGALSGNATTASSTPYWLNVGAGTNEIKTGTGDGASYTTYNVAFRSWWGIGFRDYTDGTTVNAYLDCRTGNFGTKGKLLAGNVSDTGTASQNFQVSGGAYVSGNVGVGTTNPTSRLHVSGNVIVTGVVTATDFNSTSDISLKDNIQTIVNPLDKIIKLNGVTFNWKENQKPSIGVIAQELEKVLPELVTQGNIKTVNYNGIIGVLIEAVKELKKEVEELKNLIV